ncbi:telomeric repeat-binding factor 2-interacting protein 1 isoform X2 [Gadus macrocephalus]|uniref:telomeric repeat-binding factor 2-interacting protein 1 isoform X2 n=1 Tax=Gadus macrocephalus TaxID=80720 RepID=UPI0028CB17D6|nr:telomeric repeat-binding factor 2-interacting protein 1 isoform X2 [Gadus macrocephalus]
MLPTRRSRNTFQLTTMPSKRENQGKSQVISPVLFMTVDGEPMRFFLCPGPAKVELLPSIKAGGGMVCKAQEPGAVLLVDPNEMGSLTRSTAHWYVSAQYIRDCIEKNEQLELEDYRMKPDAADVQSTKKRAARTSTSLGRIPYTSEEDAAIIGYVATLKDKLKGNLLWKQMAEIHLTQHSWQSMKYHYIYKLMDRPTEAKEQGRRNGVSMADDKRSDVQPTADPPSDPDVTLAEEEVEEEEKEVEEEVKEAEKEEEEEEEEVGEEAEEEEENEVEVALPAGLPVSPQHNPSPDTPQQSSFHLLMLPDMPPLEPPSRKKARTSSPRGSPKASTSAGTPSSRPPPPPRPSPPPRQPIEGDLSADGASNPVIQNEAEKTGKSGEKRKLGILEIASEEFEDDSESDYEEAHDVPEPMRTQQPRATTSKHPMGTPDMPMETRTVVETGPTPKPHLFIFDRESQEEGSQPMECEGAAVPAGPQPISKEAEVESMTQVQLKEDMQRIRALMKQTNQNLVSVTKVLLKTSGDFSAALALLLRPDSARGPFWSQSDDRLLMTSDTEARQQLQKRYGEQGVAKRLVFLEGANDADDPPELNVHNV